MGAQYSKVNDYVEKITASIGLTESILFIFIIIGYIATLGLHASSTFVCDNQITEQTFDASVFLSIALAVLVLIYTVVVYTRMWNGKYMKYHKSFKYVSVVIFFNILIIFGLSIGDAILAGFSFDSNNKLKDPATSANTLSDLRSQFNTYNISKIILTFIIVLLCFLFFGFQINTVGKAIVKSNKAAVLDQIKEMGSKKGSNQLGFGKLFSM